MGQQEKGKRRLVTAAWRSAAKRSMESSGRSRADVGEAAGTSGPYLTMLINGKYETSSKLDALSLELGIEIPDEEAGTATVKQLVEKINDLPEDMAKHVLDIVDSMIAARSSKK